MMNATFWEKPRTGIAAALAAFACLGSVLTAQAAVRTFNGTVSKLWSNAANWSDNAPPTSGDTVVIGSGFASGNYAYSKNDIAGLTLAGLTFACPASPSLQVSGQKVVLSEGGAIGSTTATWILCGLPIELAAGSHELSAQNRIDFGGYDGTYGTLSGAGALAFTKGTLVCYTAATYSGGFTAKSGTSALLFCNSALGTGTSTFEAKSQLTFYSGCTQPNDFVFVGRADGGSDIVFRESATFSGNVTLGTQVRVCAVAKADTTLRFAGTVSMPSTGTPLLISQNAVNATIAFDAPVACSNGEFRDVSSLDHFVFNAAGNRIGNVRPSAGTVRFAVSGASDPQGAMLPFENKGAKIICEGEQETARLVCADSGKGSGHSVTSESGGTLKVNAAQNASFVGGLTGKLGFIWNPSGAYTFTASGECSFSGALVVSNGTVAVTQAGALANVSGITVAAGATLTLGAGVTVNTALDRLDLSSTGTLTLPEATSFDVGRLYVDGVLQPDGVVYTGGAAGEGQVHLDALPANATVSARIIPGIGTRHVWNGAGLSNDALAYGANWQGGTTPTFGPKCLMAIQGGSSATVASATTLNGVSEEQGAAFNLRGTGVLDLYWGGLSVVSGSALTVDAPLRICGDQTWTANEGGTVVFNTPIGDDGEAHAIVKSGAGSLQFHAANTFTGDLLVSNGSMQVFHDEPFGDPTAGRVVIAKASIGVHAADVRISRPISFENTGLYYDTVAVANSHVLDFGGPVTIKDGSRWFRAYSGSTIVFSGGVFGDNQLVMDGNRYAFTNAPSALASNFYVSNGEVTFACTNNACQELCLYGTASTLALAADNAFTNRPALRLVGGARVNLSGHDLTCSSIYGEHKAEKTDGVISSATPAVLEGNGTGSIHACFLGAVSYRVAGGSSTLYGGESTSTGRLECVGGTLTLAGGAAWTRGSAVCENADATLVVQDGSAFGRKVDVYVGKGGKLNLKNDVLCRDLYFYQDGRWVRQGVGSYGSTASGAATQSDDFFVSGSTGILRATHGGFMLIVR